MTNDRPVSYIQPLTIRARDSRVQPKGLPLINLSFNELPYAPSDSVLTAINEATDNAHLYGNPSCEALRSELANVHDLDSSHLVCGNGSEELLDVIGRVFARPGDTIVIPEYGYIQFPIVTNRVGATLLKARETDYITDVDEILAAIDAQTRIVFLANPNNPTGTMADESDLRRLANELPPHVALIIDLAYGEFAGNTYCTKVHQLVTDFENVVVTRTFSKAFGLAGLRIGWCHAPEWMIPALYAARGMGTANAAAQAGAIAALRDLDTINSRVKKIVAERDRVANALTDIGMTVIPSSANFLLCRTEGDDANSADTLASHLFDDAGIIVNRTREAGLEQFIRFSISLPEHNTLLIDTLSDIVQTRDRGPNGQ